MINVGDRVYYISCKLCGRSCPLKNRFPATVESFYTYEKDAENKVFATLSDGSSRCIVRLRKVYD